MSVSGGEAGVVTGGSLDGDVSGGEAGVVTGDIVGPTVSGGEGGVAAPSYRVVGGES